MSQAQSRSCGPARAGGVRTAAEPTAAPTAAEPAVEVTTGRPPELLRLPGGLWLRRRRSTHAVALNRAVRANLDHLRPWLEWAAEAPTRARTAELTRAGSAAWEAGTDFMYLAGLDTDPGGVIGALGLHGRLGPGALEIGYWVAAGHVGRGIATAAAGALTEAALALPGISRVEIRCDRANTASAAVPRKLGYRLDRIAEAAVRAPGETGRQLVWVRERRPHPGEPAIGGRRP
ncbi:RimJ/RimL family protein N-acetyltransferase [Streptomyces sp. 1114.5]|uniref:GNAT family N-acetyltransferase n=1 Tax=Streptomyces sp. 1114.5 TaxID=1938830 RepID=UPI000EB4BED0|nr:GNAT family protein [Streptomyces sp. 1114.5]RKT18658.1 RimJ/RimL family protein N-acetyltransferase [Streptomyces sp. 1114.5]